MNEPIALIRQGEYGKPIIVQNPLHQFSYQAESAKWDDFPLYTHPAKTLTDEEIEEVYKVVEQDFYLTESKKPDGGWRNFPIELGRAILRKAQEK